MDEIHWPDEMSEKAGGGRRRHSCRSRSGNAARFDLARGFDVPRHPESGYEWRRNRDAE
jgi:hypothetical protein